MDWLEDAEQRAEFLELHNYGRPAAVIRRLIATVKFSMGALARYGSHSRNCAQDAAACGLVREQGGSAEWRCSCGFKDALERVREGRFGVEEAQ